MNTETELQAILKLKVHCKIAIELGYDEFVKHSNAKEILDDYIINVYKVTNIKKIAKLSRAMFNENLLHLKGWCSYELFKKISMNPAFWTPRNFNKYYKIRKCSVAIKNLKSLEQLPPLNAKKTEPPTKTLNKKRTVRIDEARLPSSEEPPSKKHKQVSKSKKLPSEILICSDSDDDAETSKIVISSSEDEDKTQPTTSTKTVAALPKNKPSATITKNTATLQTTKHATTSTNTAQPTTSTKTVAALPKNKPSATVTKNIAELKTTKPATTSTNTTQPTTSTKTVAALPKNKPSATVTKNIAELQTTKPATTSTNTTQPTTSTKTVAALPKNKPSATVTKNIAELQTTKPATTSTNTVQPINNNADRISQPTYEELLLFYNCHAIKTARRPILDANDEETCHINLDILDTYEGNSRPKPITKDRYVQTEEEAKVPTPCDKCVQTVESALIKDEDIENVSMTSDKTEIFVPSIPAIVYSKSVSLETTYPPNELDNPCHTSADGNTENVEGTCQNENIDPIPNVNRTPRESDHINSTHSSFVKKIEIIENGLAKQRTDFDPCIVIHNYDLIDKSNDLQQSVDIKMEQSYQDEVVEDSLDCIDKTGGNMENFQANENIENIDPILNASATSQESDHINSTHSSLNGMAKQRTGRSVCPDEVIHNYDLIDKSNDLQQSVDIKMEQKNRPCYSPYQDEVEIIEMPNSIITINDTVGEDSLDCIDETNGNTENIDPILNVNTTPQESNNINSHSSLKLQLDAIENGLAKQTTGRSSVCPVEVIQNYNDNTEGNAEHVECVNGSTDLISILNTTPQASDNIDSPGRRSLCPSETMQNDVVQQTSNDEIQSENIKMEYRSCFSPYQNEVEILEIPDEIIEINETCSEDLLSEIFCTNFATHNDNISSQLRPTNNASCKADGSSGNIISTVHDNSTELIMLSDDDGNYELDNASSENIISTVHDNSTELIMMSDDNGNYELDNASQEFPYDDDNKYQIEDASQRHWSGMNHLLSQDCTFIEDLNWKNIESHSSNSSNTQLGVDDNINSIANEIIQRSIATVDNEIPLSNAEFGLSSDATSPNSQTIQNREAVDRNVNLIDVEVLEADCSSNVLTNSQLVIVDHNVNLNSINILAKESSKPYNFLLNSQLDEVDNNHFTNADFDSMEFQDQEVVSASNSLTDPKKTDHNIPKVGEILKVNSSLSTAILTNQPRNTKEIANEINLRDFPEQHLSSSSNDFPIIQAVAGNLTEFSSNSPSDPKRAIENVDHNCNLKVVEVLEENLGSCSNSKCTAEVNSGETDKNNVPLEHSKNLKNKQQSTHKKQQNIVQKKPTNSKSKNSNDQHWIGTNSIVYGTEGWIKKVVVYKHCDTFKFNFEVSGTNRYVLRDVNADGAAQLLHLNREKFQSLLNLLSEFSKFAYTDAEPFASVRQQSIYHQILFFLFKSTPEFIKYFLYLEEVTETVIISNRIAGTPHPIYLNPSVLEKMKQKRLLSKMVHK